MDIEAGVESGVSGEPIELAVAGDPQLLERELGGISINFEKNTLRRDVPVESPRDFVALLMAWMKYHVLRPNRIRLRASSFIEIYWNEL